MEDMHSKLAKEFFTKGYDVEEFQRQLKKLEVSLVIVDDCTTVLESLSPLFSNYSADYPSGLHKQKEVAQFKRETGSWYSRPKKGK